MLNKIVSIASVPIGVVRGMLDFIVWGLWFSMGAYCFWFFTQAKKLEPLTLDDLVIIWKIHRQQAGCKAPLSKLKPIIRDRSDEFSGFRCECGFQYLSKRPLVQRHAFEQNMFVSISPNSVEHRAILKN
jgi:hypothetical protein